MLFEEGVASLVQHIEQFVDILHGCRELCAQLALRDGVFLES